MKFKSEFVFELVFYSFTQSDKVKVYRELKKNYNIVHNFELVTLKMVFYDSMSSGRRNIAALSEKFPELEFEVRVYTYDNGLVASPKLISTFKCGKRLLLAVN